MPSPFAADYSSQPLDLGPAAIDQLEIERLRRLIAAREPGSTLPGLPADTSDAAGPPADALLERLGILAGDRLTVAGLLLLGREEELRRLLPGHQAVYLHMKSDIEYDRRFDSSKPLLALLEQFTQTIEPHNRIFTLKLGLFHFEIPDFPEEVYREALLNAFTHRDYSLPAPVFLRHYPDRLEISSPGGFFGDISVANIIGHEPVSRNRLLAETLQRIRLVERAGMGVKRMFHIQLSHGKEPPSWEAGSDFVRVTIRSGSAGQPAGIDDNFARFVVKEQQNGRQLSLADLLILTWLKRNREIDLTETRRILQRSENEVREALGSMATRGLLEPFGQKKGRVYRLSRTLYARLRKSVSYFLFRRAEAAWAETTIMAYLEQLPGPDDRRYVTNEIVRTLLRLSPHQAGYLLAGLVRRGRLTLHGRGRAARYYKTRQLSAF